jgi:hypothetical protein
LGDSVIVSVLDFRLELLVLGPRVLALAVALLQSVFEVAELECVVFPTTDQIPESVLSTDDVEAAFSTA